MRKSRPRKVKHKTVVLKGGPFNGQYLLMSTGQEETLSFRVKNEYGHYLRQTIYSPVAEWVSELTLTL